MLIHYDKHDKPNGDLLLMLRDRCEDASKRIETARQAIAEAEDELGKWKAALELELRRAKNGGPDTANLIAIPEDEHMKHDVFRKVLLAAGKPLKPTEIIQKVAPRLSKSYVYYLISEGTKNGTLKEKNGKVGLVELSGNGHVNNNGHDAEAPISYGGPLALPFELNEAPNFNFFVDALSDRGKKFMLELKERIHGIDAYEFASLLGYENPRQIGGLAGGGLAKIAKNTGINLKDVYRTEITFSKGKRTVRFYPGKLLLALPKEEKPAV
jgi:hypothetical protein